MGASPSPLERIECLPVSAQWSLSDHFSDIATNLKVTISVPDNVQRQGIDEEF